jgi:hypothetical protein
MAPACLPTFRRRGTATLLRDDRLVERGIWRGTTDADRPRPRWPHVAIANARPWRSAILAVCGDLGSSRRLSPDCCDDLEVPLWCFNRHGAADTRAEPRAGRFTTQGRRTRYRFCKGRCRRQVGHRAILDRNRDGPNRRNLYRPGRHPSPDAEEAVRAEDGPSQYGSR